jgi:hypothetical protein
MPNADRNGFTSGFRGTPATAGVVSSSTPGGLAPYSLQRIGGAAPLSR